MKICLINTYFDPDNAGGAEWYVKLLADYLGEKHEVVVITTTPRRGWNWLKPIKEKSTPALTVYRYFPINIEYYAELHRHQIWFRIIYYLLDIWNLQSYLILRKIIKNEAPDIVHTHNIYGLSLAAFHAARCDGAQHIHTLHDYQLLEPGGSMFRNWKPIQKLPLPEWLLCQMKNLLSRKIDLVIAPSQFIISLHSKYGFFRKINTRHVPFGIKGTKRPHTRVPSLPLRLGYIGRLSMGKGLANVLFAILQDKKLSVELFIAGEGELRNAWERDARGDNRIHFLGSVTGGKKDKFFDSIDILVVPSRWYENSPLVIQEAYANCLPVIASRRGGMPELVEDLETGMLISPDNSSDLFHILNNLTQHLENVTQWKDIIIKTKQNRTMDDHLKEVERLYYKIRQE